MLDHAIENGIDYEFDGVYVEGPHAGGVYDRNKEFWQQCEVMIGMLDAYLRFGTPKYLRTYETVHRFMFSKGINFDVGELWPLLTREGEPIWTHMSHSWKINYHSIRAMIQSKEKLDAILDETDRT
jgi:mannobiose 2-epimerase